MSSSIMMCVVLLFMILIDQVLPRVLYEYRLNCAESIQEWNIRKSNYICPNQGTEYHCMQLPNGKFVEFCLAKIWIQPVFYQNCVCGERANRKPLADYCPVFNASTGRINVLLCRAYQRPCPKVYFFSNELYKEPGCLISSKQQTTTTSTTSMKVSSSFNTVTVKSSTSSTNASIVGHHEQNSRDTLYTETRIPWSTYGIACGIAVPVVVLCILITIFKWKQRRNRRQRNTLDIHEAQIVEERITLLPNTGSENYDEETKEDSRAGEMHVTPMKATSEAENSDNKTMPSVEFHNEGEDYIRPYVYEEAKNMLIRARVVILVGHDGSGKKALAEELVRHGYDHVLRKCQENCELPLERDERNDGQVILWHHFFGFWPSTYISEKTFDNMKRWIKWTTECKNHAIIFTCNFLMWKKIEDIFSDNIADIQQYKIKLDLSWRDQLDISKLYLSDEEKSTIMTSKLKPSEKVGFPLLLSLYKLGFSTLEGAFAWFEKPEECIHSDLKNIHQQDFKGYVTLMYCLLNGGFIDMKNVKKSFRKEIKRMCQATTTACKSNVKSWNESVEKSLKNIMGTEESFEPMSTSDNENKEMQIKGGENTRNKMESTQNSMLSETFSDIMAEGDNLRDSSGTRCSTNKLSVTKTTLNDFDKNTEESDQPELSLYSNAQEVCSNARPESENGIIFNPDRKKADYFENKNLSLESKKEEEKSTAKSNGKRNNDQTGHEGENDGKDSRANINKEDTESSTDNVISAGTDSSTTSNVINENNRKKSTEENKSKLLAFSGTKTKQIPQLVEKYLKNEKKNVFKFRHEFLMHCLVQYHVDRFGKNIFMSEHIDKDLKSYVEQLS